MTVTGSAHSGASRGTNKRAGEGAGPSETGASTFGTPATLGVSQCAFLFPKEPLGSTWMDGLSITAKNEGQPFFPLQK